MCIGHPQNCNAQGNAKISGTPHTLDRYVQARETTNKINDDTK